MRPTTLVLLSVAVVSACSLTPSGQANEGKSFVLTHQLKFPPGGAVEEVNFGTRPEAAADRLMPTLPGAVFAAGGACAGEQAASPDYTARFHVTRDGGIRALTVDPLDPFGECVMSELGTQGPAFASTPETEIAINLRRPGAPPVPGPSPSN